MGKPLVYESANGEIVGVVSDESRQPHRGEVCEPQVAGQVVENVPIECGTWKGEESFTICEMDDIDVVLGLHF